MKFKYELNNAHVCHDNVCFKIPSVLVKNMTDKVILGLPFINALYPFLVEHDGITTDPFGQKVKFKFAPKCEIDNDYASKIFIQEPRMGFCQYFADTFKGNNHSAKLLTITNDPNILNISLQELHNATRINTINKWDIDNTSIYTMGKRTIMASSAKRRNKGKALAQGSSQDKRLPTGQSFVMHEGASSGVKSSRSKSLHEFVPAEVTYSSGDMVIALQEVLSRNLQFHNGTYSELPDFIKFILDNLQVANTRDHQKLFQKTLRALEIHLVNLTAQNEAYASHYANLVSEYANIVSENEAYRSHLVNQPNITDERGDPNTSQLFGKEEIYSMDKMTIMGIDYARLSLKTQSLLRSVLPTCLQIYNSVFWKVRLCLGLLTYGSNVSKNLLQLLFLIQMSWMKLIMFFSN